MPVGYSCHLAIVKQSTLSVFFCLKKLNSEKRTPSLQGKNGPSPICPLFWGFTLHETSLEPINTKHSPKCYIAILLFALALQQ